MSHLKRYLAVMFLQRFVITIFGLVALLGVLDALSNADLLPEDGGMTDQFRYMALRVPVLFDKIMIFALLMALLLTYVSLIRRNELVAIVGAGISVFGQVRALVPAVMIATIVSAALIDQLTPRATRALENWLGPEAVRDDGQAPKTLWLADDNLLVEVGSLKGERLSNVTLFERGENGKIGAISQAGSAKAVPEGWALMDVRQIRYDGKESAPPEIWRSEQTPHTLRLLLSEPRNLALFDLYNLSRMTGSGSLPSAAYLVWFLNRLSLPFVALGFLLMTVPIMQRFGRRDSGEFHLAIGIGAGFVFMVIDGVFKTLSENGSLSASLAVVVPTGTLLLIGLWLSYHRTAAA
ncbi:Lipopolysaccharide export system permease protein LptG [hydrothermal vent metagenome]|uniref:Lipopolysaccharide export system permease protein LptG n=1 Tax=hydrothermal vent metagenome TaxID=652676 RepID=A0A3B0SH51_9ZZZZ